jgi:hypothetical protein
MSIISQVNLPKPNPVVTEEFVQFRQVFGLHMFKLHRHLINGTVKSVWLRQVFGLLRVRVKQVALYSGWFVSRCHRSYLLNDGCPF